MPKKRNKEHNLSPLQTVGTKARVVYVGLVVHTIIRLLRITIAVATPHIHQNNEFW